MIYTTFNLLKKYSDYSNPKTKINRLLKKQELFSLSKGIYTDEKSLDPFIVSYILYGPSYISFEKALEYYDLIPERVYTITCATCAKHKSKHYSNHFGTFTYSDVPRAVYSYGVIIKYIDDKPYYIASPEKALCDVLYKKKPCKNITEFKKLLFNNLRIDEEGFENLNKDDINFLADRYHCKNVNYLRKLLGNEEKYE